MGVENFTIEDTGQLEELSAAAGWDVSYTQLERGPLGARYSIATLEHLDVHWERIGRGLDISGGFTTASVPFELLVSATGRCTFHGRELRPLQLILTGRDDGIDFTARGGVTILSIHVATERLATALRLLGRNGPAPSLESRVLDLGPQTAKELLGSARSFFGATGSQTAPEVESGLLACLVAALAKDRGVRREPQSAPHRRTLDVRRARDYIHAHYDQALRLEDICAVAGLGHRALQRGFRELLGLSPIEYVRTVRLRAVRRRLLRASAGETVTEAALAGGCFHLGHFGQHYKAMFAETPSSTLARGRAGRIKARVGFMRSAIGTSGSD